MERFTLAQAAAWTKGETRGEAELAAVSTDSRQIPADALFVPIRGERFDAHSAAETLRMPRLAHGHHLTALEN